MADIELVIKIPEAEYDLIVNDEACGLNVLTRAVANGTSLPKGHGRLIDADTYRKEMLYSREFDFFRRLDMQPTIIAADKGK